MLATSFRGVDILADRPDGSVSWMSDWTRCSELVRAGFLRSVWRGVDTYGHIDYYIVDADDAEYPVGSMERIDLSVRLAVVGIRYQ